MNKALIIFILFLTIIFFQSCQNCDTYIHTDPRIISCVFKVGSYFIYNDSTDHIIDSEYVYQYTYIKGEITGLMDNCYTYGDDLRMKQSSFRNGVFCDIIYSGSYPESLGIYDSVGYIYQRSSGYGLNLPSNDSISNFVVSGNVYLKVYKSSWTFCLIENNDTISSDLYFAPNYGIVKRVEHRPTGDVSWDLIRYHIVH